MEIERKFLVDPTALPFAPDNFVCEQITQAYLVVDEAGKEVRIRRKGAVYTLTVKSGSGLARQETEVAIDAAQFHALLHAAEGLVLEKKRYLVPLKDGLVAELDLYGGALRGLAVVEVEFLDEKAAASFSPPDWFGEEKTEDRRFKNAVLVKSGTSPEMLLAS
ncbi:MAG: CYTH domain-containing protein [Bdellovibrionales bacterium]|nr:CYTH domain-containing protein [Bdellovibrionales bacterium]